MNGRAGIYGGLSPIPGADSACAPIPAYDAIDPLTKLFSPNQRGNQVRIAPPTGTFDEEGRLFGAPVDVLNTITGISCIVGREIGVRLGRHLAVGTFADFDTIAPIVVQLRAILTIGLGSAPFQLECDWIHGTTLAITTDTIGIQARYLFQKDPGVVIDYTPPSFDIAAGIGRLEHARNSNSARLTEIRLIPNPATPKVIAIPPYTISVAIVPLTAGATINVLVKGFGGAYIETITVTSPMTLGSQVENWNGSEVLILSTPAGQPATRVAVIFGLAA